MNKKLLILAVAGAIFIILGGMNSIPLYGTQYLLSRSGFSYSIAPWWDDNWGFCKPITINHSQVDCDLTNFPILVNITDNDLRDDAQDNGDDITFIFYNGSITQLNHEIEHYNNTNGHLVAWVNIPSLSSSRNTTFYMYYGNSDCSSQENVYGTWDSNFMMVQHLNETSGNHNDSTSNDNNGVPSANLNQGINAKIYGGDQFDGTPAEADCVNWTAGHFNFDYNDSFTFESWLKMNGGDEYPIAKGNTNWGYRLHTFKDGDLEWMMKVNGASRQIRRCVDAFAVDSGWHHVVVTYNGSRDVSGLKIYVDSNEPNTQGTNNNVEIGDSMQTDLIFFLGRNSGTTAYWYEGYIDEFRISNTNRSNDWITTSYNTMHNTSTFISISSEETQS